MRLLLSMGIKRNGRTDSPLRALLREIDADTGAVLRDFHWDSTPGCWPGGDEPCAFTAAVLAERLVVPSRTEVLFFDPVRWRVEDVWSSPWFSDLHSVTPAAHGWWVTATGYDAVLRMVDGRCEELRSLRGEVPEERDWRMIPAADLKPHHWHPNYAVQRSDGLWVTSFEGHGCVNLDTDVRIPLPEGPPHDGILRQGRIWYTTVTGHVIAIDPETRVRVAHIDLNLLCDAPGLLGWCRGIEVVGNRLFVGFTMLRRSRMREALGWMTRGPKHPTRIVEIDLAGPRVVRESRVGNRAGGSIYSIVAIP